MQAKTKVKMDIIMKQTRKTVPWLDLFPSETGIKLTDKPPQDYPKLALAHKA